MILETEIDGLLYSIDTDEQVATVKRYEGNAKEVVIPESFFHEGIVYMVTSIEEYAFTGCSSLTDINIPKSVTSIERSAFSGCSSLTAIIIPEGVTSIREWAFSNCSSLNTIIVAKGNTLYDSREGCNAVIETNSNTLVVGCAKSVIPGSVTSIGEWAFYGCSSLTAINIAKSVTSIGKEALKNSGITYLTILGKPTIDKLAFEGCNKLTDIFCNSEENLLAEEAFNNLDLSRITLYVPESAMETYKNIEPRVGSVRAFRFFEW